MARPSRDREKTPRPPQINGRTRGHSEIQSILQSPHSLCEGLQNNEIRLPKNRLLPKEQQHQETKKLATQIQHQKFAENNKPDDFK